MIYAFFIFSLVVADQLIKYMVRAVIPLHGAIASIPGVVEFTYVQNTGAAFNLFSQYTWLLTAISGVVAVALAVVLWKKILFTSAFGQFSLCLVLAGAIGNFIDRLLFGYVTDMFRLLFINFAVFNIADICVVVGGITACVYFMLFEGKKGNKPEEKNDDQPEPDC